ncbi:MAG: hypothetical protein IKJ65_06030, partial [Clostridia bacterium]|nr:hypothetical protein [Clostridia bacterium]
MHNSPEKETELSTTGKVEESSVLLYNEIGMNKIQHEQYITIQQGCQQLRLKICGGIEFKAEKEEFFRQVSDQLGRLDYSELYNAYSGMIRKSQVEPRILFEILICAYML